MNINTYFNGEFSRASDNLKIRKIEKVGETPCPLTIFGNLEGVRVEARIIKRGTRRHPGSQDMVDANIYLCGHDKRVSVITSHRSPDCEPTVRRIGRISCRETDRDMHIYIHSHTT